MRTDVFLCEKGYVKSRSRAKALIDDGHVLLDGKRVEKCSEFIDESAEHIVEITDELRYVSRGGLKLEHALDVFSLDVTGMCALDVGASTGGFTDCLLQRGVKKVYAIDAGEGQLDPKIKQDCRVESREKCNARGIKRQDFSDLLGLAVIDVSFISQTLILPALADVLPEGAFLVSLIKPQFEVGKSGIGKGGIVKSEKERAGAVCNVLDCAEALGFGCLGLDVSSIRGGDGNVEFVALFQKGAQGKIDHSFVHKTVLR